MFKLGESIVAILAPRNADRPFYLGKVLRLVGKEKLEIQWYGSKTVDSSYNPEYKKGAARGKGSSGKAQAVPHTATVWRHAVVDHAVLSNKTKGRLGASELKRLRLLVKQSQTDE